jgi:hypothetical protein
MTARNPDPITVALATQPTARGRWVMLPVDAGEPPRLADGDECHVITARGDIEEAVYVVRSGAGGGRYFEIDGESADVVAVWIASRSGPSGAVWSEQQYAARGYRSIKLRLPSAVVDLLDAEAKRSRESRAATVERLVRGGKQ